MRSYLTAIPYALVCCIANFSLINTAYAIEFRQDTRISATDSRYDGQDLTVNGATLTIDGEHQFTSVRLLNGALLTHSVAATEKLVLTSKSFFIDTDSSINISAKGRAPTSEVTDASGGSYGGRGGIYNSGGSTNPVFGDPRSPDALGIGGIGSAGSTHGGGAITINAEQMTISGHIIADGLGFTTFFSSQGGGSGGSIWLNVGTLNGSGTLQASGGSGYTFYGGGGGGGGRIAVYYQSANFDLQNNIINKGGVYKPLFGEPGQDGSIFLKDTNAVNQPPLVDAGLSLFVNEQTAVTLSGSASDTNGVIVSQTWSQLSGPAVSLSDVNSSTPGFIAPEVLTQDSPSVLTFRLTVIDDDGASAFSDTSVAVLASNAAPVADAGTDFSAEPLSDVILAGSATDSDGLISHYTWQQISGPTVTLNNSNSSTATFTTPDVSVAESLVFQLTVTDNETATHSDTVTVSIQPDNILPLAKIIVPGQVAENTAVNLDGTTSTDSDGTISQYHWTQLSGPVVMLTGANSAQASFIAPSVYSDTALRFQLDIIDNKGGMASASSGITVVSTNPDDDADNMPDLWEIQFFNTLDHDGTADTDNDGATDAQEYALETNPTAEQQPAQPQIVSPDGIEVNVLQPLLSLSNPSQPNEFLITYAFEIYRDTGMNEQIITTSGVDLAWTVSKALDDNTRYYWRARASGTQLHSEWVSSDFFVNTENDAPGAFSTSYPQDNVSLTSTTPGLSVTNSVDIDEDSLTYRFEVYSDGQLITSADNIPAGSNGTTAWTVDRPLQENHGYQWRVIATDEHGLSTVSSDEPVFFINTVNNAPASPALIAPLDGSEVTTLSTELRVANSVDPEGEAVHYFFELDTANTFNTVNIQSSGNVSETVNSTGWPVSTLMDNTWYYWRAKASDGLSESPWLNAAFFVNRFNDAPGIPKTLNPGDQAWVANLRPTLEVYPATDIDNDALSYEFEVYKMADKGAQYELLASGQSTSTFWQADLSAYGSGNYYWHARAIDEHGLAGDWSELAMFFADNDGHNEAPVIKLKSPKTANTGKRNQHVLLRWQDTDSDSNASINLYYDLDNSGFDGIAITGELKEDPDGNADHFLWNTASLPEGPYYIYAIISDESNSYRVYAETPYLIKHGRQPSRTNSKRNKN